MQQYQGILRCQLQCLGQHPESLLCSSRRKVSVAHEIRRGHFVGFAIQRQCRVIDRFIEVALLSQQGAMGQSRRTHFGIQGLCLAEMLDCQVYLPR